MFKTPDFRNSNWTPVQPENALVHLVHKDSAPVHIDSRPVLRDSAKGPGGPEWPKPAKARDCTKNLAFRSAVKLKTSKFKI